MLIILGFLISGIVLGRLLLRGRDGGIVARAIVGIVRLLLFSLGLEVGADKAIMGSLGALGITALWMTAASLAGSILAASLLWAAVGKEGAGTRTEPRGSFSPGPRKGWRGRMAQLWGSLRGSLLIVLFFLAGMMLGSSGVVTTDFKSLPLTSYVLYALLLCVGLTIGSDDGFFRQIRDMDRKMMLLPLATACGTFLGMAALWLFMGKYLLTDCLAVGSGFAYYSLSSIFITEMRGAELGTVALLCNIFREISALLLIPLVARLLNPLAAISMGGATTFDTSLPVIMQTVGKEYFVVTAFHGLLLDFSVPFLVTFFCGIAA